MAVPLALVIAVGFGWRAQYAVDPNVEHLSQDEFSYVTLAQRLNTNGTYEGGERWPLRWPPGTPMLFALAQRVDSSGSRSGRRPDIPSAYWAQVAVGTGTILAAFALAALIGGAVAGVLAAAAVALYPPLVTATGELLSEPLGTLLLTGAVLAFVLALRRSTVRPYVVAGVLLAATVWVRADFLFLAAVLALLAGMVAWRRRDRHPWRGALVLVGATAAVVAPWSAYVSMRAGHVTLFTTGDAPVLFVGTCVPCDGTLQGMKRVYGEETRRKSRFAAFAAFPTPGFPPRRSPTSSHRATRNSIAKPRCAPKPWRTCAMPRAIRAPTWPWSGASSSACGFARVASAERRCPRHRSCSCTRCSPCSPSPG